MEEYKLRYYIASPGFNQEQLGFIHQVEATLDAKQVDYFSPFTHGGTLRLGSDMELNKLNVKLLFDENIKEIKNCNRMIALVNDLDKGTAFEIGYFIGEHVRDLEWINEHLLLLGKLSGEMSEYILNVIRSYSWEDIVTSPLAYIDISNKTMDRYILLGLLNALNVPVMTVSTTELESNLMTSCSVMRHKQIDKSESFEGLMNVQESAYSLYADSSKELFNLHHLKLAKKIE